MKFAVEPTKNIPTDATGNWQISLAANQMSELELINLNENGFYFIMATCNKAKILPVNVIITIVSVKN